MTDNEDVGISPLHEVRDTKFKPGQSGNPAGRPKGSSKAKSRMRTTLTKLYTLEADAIELLRQNMSGKDKEGNKVSAPSKDKMDSAKYVLKAITEFNSMCLKEESLIIDVRDRGKVEDADNMEQESAAPATEAGFFSMEMPTEAVKH